MNNPPLDEQNCDSCRYKRHRRGEDLCCINPPRLVDSGMMPICPVSRWCGGWVER